MQLVYRSIKVKLDLILEDENTEKNILSKLEKCRDLTGKNFRVIFWNEKITKKEIESFIKRNSNLLIKLNSDITKDKTKFGWFTMGDKILFKGSFRYLYEGNIMTGLDKYMELVTHIIKRENEIR